MVPPIPFFDVAAAYRGHRSAIDSAVARVLASGNVVLGPEVEAFEAEFAAYVGTRFAVGVASGTDALALALRAVGVGCGDEVVTVANAGVPPVAAIRAIGAAPRYVDVDPETLLFDATEIAAVVSDRTRAILPVHLYGQPLPMVAIAAAARRFSLPIVEDCAHAHGTRIDGEHAGTFGAVGCFSFYPTKNLGAFGDAGACVTNDPGIASALRRLRVYGADAAGSVPIPGVNSRLDEIQAAILRVLLHGLDTRVGRRGELASQYDSLLRDTSVRSMIRPGVGDAYHLYVVRHPSRDRLIDVLAAAGIGCKAHYPLATHGMPAFRDPGRRISELPNTMQGCAEVLSLPLYPELEPSAVERVARELRSC